LEKNWTERITSLFTYNEALANIARDIEILESVHIDDHRLHRLYGQREALLAVKPLIEKVAKPAGPDKQTFDLID
jgi:hypothetical protein